MYLSNLPRDFRNFAAVARRSHLSMNVLRPPRSSNFRQIFLSFFKTLVGKEIAVELKNDVVLTGTLHSVDQYLNVKLMNVKIINPEKYPQLTALHNCFVRGSVVRYIQIPPEYVDTELLQDAARKENAPASATK
jgi:small nuclear ribonucleoprotein (snRNP)-like protein